MKTLYHILLLSLFLLSCSEKQNSIEDYRSTKVKFGKTKMLLNQGEFSMFLPVAWSIHEDPVHSDTTLYVLEAGSKGKEFVGIGILKLKMMSSKMDSELDFILNQATKRAKNVKVLEKTKIKVGEKWANAAFLSYEYQGRILQEEIDILLPINKTQYYHVGLVCDKNENTANNFGMMLECVQSFRLLKD